MRTLVCVLDWGLGHASRSLALLDHSLLAGDEVFLASSGPAAQFLRRERPDLPLFELPAYAVRYPTGNMPLNVALQFPRWWWTARREGQATRRLVREHRINRIVSDNRFGCHVAGVPSVFLTHQLHPITHSRPVSWLYRHYLKKFGEFWVPDTRDQQLSGELSAPTGYENVRYIGPLSRLESVAAEGDRLRTLSILSGPEPMRSRLEQALLTQLSRLPGRHHLVRGVPGTTDPPKREGIDITSFADRTTLSKLIARADTIICRSGYSTLMDLAAVQYGGKLVLIPTPGQTEQEYLALAQVESKGNRTKTLAQDRITELPEVLKNWD
ncbi:glycosyltransferase [Lewinella sp. 4G2]|uniref:glycosyltransferase n=1 Tax=Lewinella sp. 4G2 TaxID=1803372 RepID=UPI0007B469F0|nr:glycosyltransferase [Lewinella sp. 4G2]OAV43146.1 hypothetical protein A3850_000945 [Lewinella sp. 4G2]